MKCTASIRTTLILTVALVAGLAGPSLSQAPAKSAAATQLKPGIQAAAAQILRVPIPNLDGKTRDEASAILEGARLKLGDVFTIPSEKPPERVASQSPSPSAGLIRAGTKVDIWLAVPKETPLTVVPNVVGQVLTRAELILKKSNLALGIIARQNSNIPVDEVLAQSVPAGYRVPAGSAIDVTAASAGLVRVPGLKGKQLKEAQSILSELQLGIGATAFQIAAAPAGEILDQDVMEGAEVQAGTLIGLTVAELAPSKDVPNVVGQPRDKAIRILIQAGFAAGAVEERGSSKPRNEVLEQSPAAGTPMPENAPVDLVIAIAEFKVPALVGKQAAVTEYLLTAEGFSQGTMAREFSLFTPAGEVMRQTPGGGELLAAPQPVDIVVAYNLPPWTPLPLLVLVASSVGLLLVRRVSPSKPKEPPSPPMVIRSTVKSDPGHPEVSADKADGPNLEIVIRLRADGGTQSVHELES